MLFRAQSRPKDVVVDRTRPASLTVDGADDATADQWQVPFPQAAVVPTAVRSRHTYDLPETRRRRARGGWWHSAVRHFH